MTEQLKPPLAQDYMRSAIREGTLAVFDELAADVRNSDLSDLARLNAGRAATFGLAGLMIRGWEGSVVAEHDGWPYKYTFTPTEEGFGPADLSAQKNGTEQTDDYYASTVGDRALGVLKLDLFNSAQAFYTAEPGERSVEGLDVHEIAKYNLSISWDMTSAGLHKVPTAFYRAPVGGYQPEHFILTAYPDTSLQKHTLPIANSSGNFIRFTREAIGRLMLGFAARSPEQSENQVMLPEPAEGVEPFSRADVWPAVESLLRDPVRHSQRMDGTYLHFRSSRLSEPRDEELWMERDPDGRAFLNWKGRKPCPPMPWESDKAPQISNKLGGSSMAARAARQKCPIGYTIEKEVLKAEPTTARYCMPGHRLADATLQFMYDNGLTEPDLYATRINNS